jgi:hypothetical protein
MLQKSKQRNKQAKTLKWKNDPAPHLDSLLFRSISCNLVSSTV